MYTFCRSELLYTKCIQNVCMQNVSQISTNLYTFCIQKLAAIVLLILYTKCAYKSLSKCGVHFVYILYNFCVQNVYTVSVWEVEVMRKIFEGLVKSSKS